MTYLGDLFEIALKLALLTFYLGALVYALPIPVRGLKRWGGVLIRDSLFSFDLVPWANNDIGTYTLWIWQQARGRPTPLNPAEAANLRFMSWANGGELYLNASLYNADTDSFYNFYMRPGARIGLGNEVQENGMYYSGAYGLISELSNIGRGSPSPWGEVANFLGRLAGELLYGLTGNYVPVEVVLGTAEGAHTFRGLTCSSARAFRGRRGPLCLWCRCQWKRCRPRSLGP